MNSPHNQVGGVFHLEGRVPSTLAVEVYEPPPHTHIGEVSFLEGRVSSTLAAMVYYLSLTPRLEGSSGWRGKSLLPWLWQCTKLPPPHPGGRDLPHAGARSLYIGCCGIGAPLDILLGEVSLLVRQGPSTLAEVVYEGLCDSQVE